MKDNTAQSPRGRRISPEEYVVAAQARLGYRTQTRIARKSSNDTNAQQCHIT